MMKKKRARQKRKPTSPDWSVSVGRSYVDVLREPVSQLPPYTIHKVYVSLGQAQTVDWGLNLLNVPLAHLRSRGAGIKIGVCDTGCDLDHPDLAGKIITAADFTGSPNGAEDANGHGSHVAGTICMVDNQQGGLGVAPDAGLIISKVLGDNGSGYSDGIARGADWAVGQDADILSLSLGSPQPDAMIRAALQRAIAAGKIVIVAIGNAGTSGGGYPGKYPENCAVAAFDRNRQIADFSSRDAEVDVAAPGVEILSTFLDGGYAVLSGTSMATPFVSGIAALWLSYERSQGRNPNQQDFLSWIQQTATDAGEPGRDFAFGWGIITSDKLFAPEPIPPPPDPTPEPPPPDEPPWEPTPGKQYHIEGTITVK